MRDEKIISENILVIRARFIDLTIYSQNNFIDLDILFFSKHFCFYKHSQNISGFKKYSRNILIFLENIPRIFWEHSFVYNILHSQENLSHHSAR